MVDRYVQFTLSISMINRFIQKIEKQAMEKYGLKGSHAQCIISMSAYEQGITAADLCRLCDKDKAAISRTVCELEQAGYVERHGDGDNMYRALLVLTDSGKKLAKEVSDLAVIAVKKADIGLSEENRRVFYQTLELFSKNLYNITREGLK